MHVCVGTSSVSLCMQDQDVSAPRVSAGLGQSMLAQQTRIGLQGSAAAMRSTATQGRRIESRYAPQPQGLLGDTGAGTRIQGWVADRPASM